MKRKERKKQELPLVSVVTTVYNTEQYIPACIESICNQTYKNLQIIVVNDASKGNIGELISEYQQKDSRIIYVDNEKNLGLFHARQAGAVKATGDYICFIDSDDYWGLDYVRCMVMAAEKHDADIVKTNFVLTDETRFYIHGHINNQPEIVLQGKKILDAYFKQEGRDFSWHTVWNKLYKKTLWDKCIPYYQDITSHLIMAEDFAYSTPLFTFAKKMVGIETDEYFYLQRASASTGIERNIKKYQKNILDLGTAFGFAEKFLKKVDKWKEYETLFINWRKLYSRFWCDNVNNAGFGELEVKRLENLLGQVMSEEKLERSQREDHYFYSNTVDWNNRLVEAKKRILNPAIEVVSFDIFDTLIQRPLLEPVDLFTFVENKKRTVFPSMNYKFAKFRKDAEVLARRKKGIEEVSLAEIYQVMQEEYGLPVNVANELMQAEMELELEFCYPRKTAKQLYELALFVGKKVIITSDMYLPEKIVKQLLEKNGYDNYERLYLSCVGGKTKAVGNLYDQLLEELQMKPAQILHIGDNWQSDIEMTRTKGICNVFFPKATEVFKNNLEFGGYPAGASWGYVLNSWNAIYNNSCSIEFLGVRCMYALVANEYFDNPYRSFQKNSDFNASPYYMGLYALGMHLYGVTADLIQKYGHRRAIHFVSRDGYLCKKIYDRIAPYYGAVATSNYLHLSRKALLPTSFTNQADFFEIEDGISKDCIVLHSPKSILKNFLNIEPDTEVKELLKKEGIHLNHLFTDVQEFRNFLKVLGKQDLIYKKLEAYSSLLKEHFTTMVKEKDVLFDIGYNGTGQYLLSRLLDKKIDGYYIYINKEKALRYAKMMGYEVSTFYDATPGVSGTIREFLISECTPSCIGYERKETGIQPVFEEDTISYPEKWVANSICTGVERFTELMVTHFSDYMKEFAMRSYDCSIPLEYLMHKAKDLDRWSFHCCKFEDDVFYGGSMNLYRVWNDAVMFYYAPTEAAAAVVDENAVERYAELQGIYSDGIAVAMFKKVNKVLPLGTKRREVVKKLLKGVRKDN